MRYIVLCLCVFLSSVVLAEPRIVIDPKAKTIKVVDSSAPTQVAPQNQAAPTAATGSTSTTGSTNTQPVQPTTTQKPQTTATPTKQATQDMFSKALAWMYTNGLTKYNTANLYQPDQHLTREQFAKMVRQFYVTMGYDTSTKNTACNFSDLGGADPTLLPHIKETCRLGIFRGSAGKFYPFKSITKAEVLAVLLRIYNKKKLNETLDPWRKEYYVQAHTMGITSESQSQVAQVATRRIIALYVWRLRSVILADRNKNDTGSVPKNTNTSNNLEQSVGGQVSGSIDRDPVLLEAMRSMYEQGMIDSDRWSDVALYGDIKRADVAIILDVFGKLYVSNYRQKDIPSSCDFADIRDLKSSTQNHIKRLCAMSILKGDSSSGKFFPHSPMTKAQFVATVVRMIDGIQDEKTTPRWDNYYKRALSWKLISAQERPSFERNMKRIEVVNFVHKLKIHALLGYSSSQKNELLANEFVRVIENSDGVMKAYIDSNFLRNIDTKVGYVTLDTDSRYKVMRDHIQEYPNGRLAWYGSMMDQVSSKKVGSLWFLTEKGRVIEGVIRLTTNDQYYTISPDENSYYRYSIVKGARKK